MTYRSRWWWFCAAIAWFSAVGCSQGSTANQQNQVALANVTSTVTRSPAQSTTPALGDAARGLAAIKRFECVRCHEGLLGVEPAPLDKQCVGCHRQIIAGTYPAPPSALVHWRRHLRHLLEVPSLAQSNVRLRATFLRGFLRTPNDLRPGLEDRMPILSLSEQDAADIAALLGGPEDTTAPASGDLERGRKLFSTKGCSNCHAAGRAERPAIAALPVALTKEALLRGLTLAPDLGYTKQRSTVRSIRAWLARPSAIMPNPAMPDFPLSATEIEDLVTFIMSLSPRPAEVRPFERHRLNRPIGHAEVEQRVLRQSCWHCHSDPDFAFGDGGPGNTGGLGFAGQSVVVANWEGLHAGYVPADGKRQSLLQGSAGKPPPLLQSLLARREEEAGRHIDGVLGMPLGLPSLSDEEINLVADWLEQGARLEGRDVEAR